MSALAFYPSLGLRAYRTLWIGIVPYHFAWHLSLVASGVAALALGDNALSVGLVAGSWALPVAVLAPFGGLAADRLDRRRLVILGPAVLGTGALAVGVLALAGLLTLWMLVAFGLLQGVTFAFFSPARTAYSAQAVGSELVSNAMAAYSFSESIAGVFGPLLGGALLELLVGAYEWAYLAIAAIYLSVAAGFTRLPRQPRHNIGDLVSRSVVGAISDAITYVRQTPPLPMAFLSTILAMMLIIPYVQLMPVFATDVWDVGASGLGVLLSAAGIGAIVGSLSVAHLRFETLGRRPWVPSALAGVAGLFVIAFAAAPSFAWAVIAVLAAGAAGAGFRTLNYGVIIASTTTSMYGRVASLHQVAYTLGPIGALVVAALADLVGPRWAVGAASLIVVVLLPLVWMPQRRTSTPKDRPW